MGHVGTLGYVLGSALRDHGLAGGAEGRTPMLAAVRRVQVSLVTRARPACSHAAGPDTSRGYDVARYHGLWTALSKEKQWPTETTIAVIGPAGDEYLAAAQACLASTAGCESVGTSLAPRSRFQSIRLSFQCESPDAFCALHSCLTAIPGTRAVV